MQLHYFPDGGFVIHKAVDGYVSAWFDKDGNLLDAEKRTVNDRMRKPSKATKAYLIGLGRRWIRRDSE